MRERERERELELKIKRDVSQGGREDWRLEREMDVSR